MHKKKVTILITVLNKKETIEQCINSILKQKYPYEKILVMDGGSIDGTYEILKKYKKKIDLRQFLNTGHSCRLNLGLDIVRTKYTALTDADCIVATNWLDELIKGFNEKDIVATAGYCGTPKNVSILQKIIGMELENRFKKLPKYLFRAPTMNLCLKTDIARKIKFDEKQKVAVETDFGFRLSKFGKIKYCPESIVWHYHRANLKNYFHQQKKYAQWGVRLIINHKKRAISDPITTFRMTIQIPLFLGLLFFSAISFINPVFFYLVVGLFFIILLIYFKNIIEINPPLTYYPLFLLFFMFRTMAWSIGVFSGVIIFITELKK